MRCACALLLLGIVFGSSAVVITNVPVADTYFEMYGSQARNFGSEPQLRVDQWGGRQTFLRFAMDDVPTNRHLASATLRLFITDLGFNEAGEFPELKTCLSIHDVVPPWTESGLTYERFDGDNPWHQGPGIGGSKYGDVGPLPPPDISVHLNSTVAFDGHAVRKNSWLEIDLTDFVREQQRTEKRELNLLLRASTLGRNYTFRSREAMEAGERPHLLVTMAEDLPPQVLEAVAFTNWAPNLKIRVNRAQAQPLPPETRVRWHLTAAPRLRERASLELRGDRDGVEFNADAPGRYRIAGEILRDGKPAVRIESHDIHVIQANGHPRLYVTPKSLPRLRENARSGTRSFTAFKTWVDNGNAGVTQGKYHDMGAKEGCEDNALMFLLTSDRRYASNSIAYAGRMLMKPLREHFRDVHEVTYVGASWAHAMAVHYDWCYDLLEPEHRQAAAAWLKEAARWSARRSPAPIAHNDGGARQVLLASAPLALLGDDPEAIELLRASRDNFSDNLLPWLNDGGRGGRSGDGGEYEGLHAFYIVKYAWMAHTAAGEDVFSESPFFFNRLKHVLFGWYPRKLWERHGAYSMRQYYSPSGDHIRMGYVGDTQPYQSAAALAARYRETPEASAVRWLAGDWPATWMQYTLKWAVLGEWDRIEPLALTNIAVAARSADAPMEHASIPTAYLDPGCNTVYMRSDWSDDATWVLFENSPLVSAHGSLDSGTFEIFKGDLLAARTGTLDHANVGAKHSMNYLHRTIAANALLIDDPDEKWKGFLGGAEGIHDGGGERTNWPLTTSPEIDTYLNYREIFQRGQITQFKHTNDVTYAMADLTPAYNNPKFHGGKLNKPKVTRVTRQLAYLRSVDAVLVFDRVTSTRPEFKKTWLLHSLGDLDVLDGRETKIDNGEYHYSGATRSVIRHGWPKPHPSFARCLNVTLLPENPRVVKIGGRIELPEGESASWPGDQWHQKHRHRHLKDFWVSGTNYPPGNPPEVRWFGEPGSSYYVPGTPDESGGRGKWRIEVSPPDDAATAVFFNVLCPRLGRDGDFPEVTRMRTGAFVGALLREGTKDASVFFADADESPAQFDCTVPDRAGQLVILNLRAGAYRVFASGRERVERVEADGSLILESIGGKVSADRIGH